VLVLTKGEKLMKKLICQKGFTLVQLVVSIAIIGILAGIALPRFMGANDESKRVVCLANRTKIERSFQLARAYNEYTDLTTFLEAVKNGEEDALKYFSVDPICPSGGTYSVSDGHVVCSVEDHSDVVTGDSGDSVDNGDTGGTGDTGDTGDTSSSTLDAIKTSADGSWQEALEKAADSSGGISLTTDENGNYVDSVLYEQYGEYYLVFNSQYLNHGLGVSEKALAKYAKNNNSVVKVDFDADVLTSDDYTTTASGDLVWATIPSAGDIYQDGDDYYVRKYDSNSIWTALDVTDLSQWAKL
jgi:prepilin-type N-terminal cleavage/methylation domain-containing protein